MLISIVIPTLNEEKALAQLLPYLKADPSFPLVQELIVVDAASTDATRKIAQDYGAIVVTSKVKGRAYQMNLGATRAQSEVLYFLHADTFPPVGFAQSIWDAVRRETPVGCFRLRFDWNHWFLSANSWFTRFPNRILRFGDQSLFVRKPLFEQVGGFNEAYKLFEDQDLIKRLMTTSKFGVMPGYVLTSARKYRANGAFRLQLVYFLVYLCYALGFSQSAMMKLYLKLIPHPRI